MIGNTSYDCWYCHLRITGPVEAVLPLANVHWADAHREAYNENIEAWNRANPEDIEEEDGDDDGN